MTVSRQTVERIEIIFTTSEADNAADMLHGYRIISRSETNGRIHVVGEKIGMQHDFVVAHPV